jgi:hypothetical protein
MGTIQRLFVAVVGLGLSFVPARATDMTGSQIRSLISGKSVYVKLNDEAAAGNHGVIYYGEDGNALFRGDQGRVWHGTWSIKGNAACVEWVEEPANPCSRYKSSRGIVEIINASTSRPRGTILRVKRGNVENIRP